MFHYFPFLSFASLCPLPPPLYIFIFYILYYSGVVHTHNTYTRTHVHTYTQTYTHTHTHTYLFIEGKSRIGCKGGAHVAPEAAVLATLAYSSCLFLTSPPAPARPQFHLVLTFAILTTPFIVIVA